MRHPQAVVLPADLDFFQIYKHSLYILVNLIRLSYLFLPELHATMFDDVIPTPATQPTTSMAVTSIFPPPPPDGAPPRS